MCVFAALAAGNSVSYGQTPSSYKNKQVELNIAAISDAKGACVIPEVSPNGGNVLLRLPVPGPGDKPDHRIVWLSSHAFSVEFGAIREPGQPEPEVPVLGDEKKGQKNDATFSEKDKRYEFRLKLKTGKGNETVIAKYTVSIKDCAKPYDPVIIVDR